VVTARRTDHRTTPSTPPSLPPSRDVKRPPVRIGWNRSIDRSIRQTDRQTDRQTVSVTVTKKKRSQETIPILSKFAGFFIDRSDRSIPDRNPIETRDLLRGTRSIRFDPIDSRSIRFGIDSISISIRSDARIDRWFLSIERPPGCGSTDGATVQANRRSVGRFAFVRYPHHRMDTPTAPTGIGRRRRADARARPTGTIRRAIRRAIRLTDGRTLGRRGSTRRSVPIIHPVVRRGVTSSVICYL